MVYCSTSHASAATSMHTSSDTAVHYCMSLVMCPRSDTVIVGHINRFCYLLSNVRPRSLPAWRLHRCRTSAAVATLAAGAALHHMQDGSADTQGPDDFGAVIPERHAVHGITSESAPISRRATTGRSMHSNGHCWTRFFCSCHFCLELSTSQHQTL